MFTSKDKAKGAGAAGPPSILSENLRVKGDLSSVGEMQIDGAVDGDVRAATLTIGKSGGVTGTVTADVILVRGTVNGPIRGGRVTLAASARVTGDIQHETLTIEPGAYFEGHSRRTDRPAAGEARINLVADNGTAEPTRRA
jgi:cytoskeletal protein CcmA (bactofilin family)